MSHQINTFIIVLLIVLFLGIELLSTYQHFALKWKNKNGLLNWTQKWSKKVFRVYCGIVPLDFSEVGKE